MSVACEFGRTARPSRDGDERVADGAQLLLQTGAATALATTALGAPGLAAGHAALALAKAVSPLQIVGHLWRGAERARIHGINRRSGAGPDVRAIRLALANDQPRQLAAVAFE